MKFELYKFVLVIWKVGIFTCNSSYCCSTSLLSQFCSSVRLSVCLSVCLSHGWISQKRCELRSPNLHHRLRGRLYSFRNRKAFHKFKGDHPEQER